MGKYGTLFTKIWTDKKFRKLEEKDRYLFIYLLSSPHLNMLGLFYLPPPYISYDLQWKDEDTIRAINNLSKEDIIKYDYETNIIFVKNYLKYNKIQNPNQVKGAIKVLSELPETPLFIDLVEIFKQYNEQYSTLFDESLKELPTVMKVINKNITLINKPTESFELSKKDNSCETVQKQFSNPSETDSKSIAIATATAIEKISCPTKLKKNNSINKYENEFNDFWNSYPRKEGKSTTYKRFLKILNTNKKITPLDLINSAKKYSLICKKENREQQYIKMPATFLGRDESYKDYLILSDSNSNSQDTLFSNHNPEIDYQHLGCSQPQDFSDLLLGTK